MGVNRLEEAEEYLKRVMRTDKEGVYLVPNGKGNVYHVNLKENTCTCPDHQYRRTECKHLIAAKIKDAEIKKEVFEILSRNPGMRIIGNNSLVNNDADTRRWHLYENMILGRL